MQSAYTGVYPGIRGVYPGKRPESFVLQRFINIIHWSVYRWALDWFPNLNKYVGNMYNSCDSRVYLPLGLYNIKRKGLGTGCQDRWIPAPSNCIVLGPRSPNGCSQIPQKLYVPHSVHFWHVPASVQSVLHVCNVFCRLDVLHMPLIANAFPRTRDSQKYWKYRRK